ncbi:hypothetical protein [Leisingera aquaemixtae]|uniref:Uncharacterized protein n=1 Tax=Leisingera aquaemixtae TaxID=1396826 RepID=A0A0P1HDS5_9RHOB|nr:hypothetical protein [Leisingera aquaemixtae]CUI01865.1 hypothetical protein PHA8399_04014 [Leisingera aquaemixtae]
MSFDTEYALQDIFREAVKEHLVLNLKTDADWTRFRAISESARDQINTENESYRRDYEARVDKARQKILHKAGSLTHDHPTPHGIDRFDKDVINREAQRIVRHDHARRLYTIREDEITGYEALQTDIRARGQIRGQARDPFNRATERRSGPDRRRE